MFSYWGSSKANINLTQIDSSIANTTYDFKKVVEYPIILKVICIFDFKFDLVPWHNQSKDTECREDFQTCVSLMKTMSENVRDTCSNNCWAPVCFIYLFPPNPLDFLFCAQFYWIWGAFLVVSGMHLCYNSWISLLGSVKSYLMDWLLRLSEICESVSVLWNDFKDLDFSTWCD